MRIFSALMHKILTNQLVPGSLRNTVFSNRAAPVTFHTGAKLNKTLIKLHIFKIVLEQQECFDESKSGANKSKSNQPREVSQNRANHKSEIGFNIKGIV